MTDLHLHATLLTMTQSPVNLRNFPMSPTPMHQEHYGLHPEYIFFEHLILCYLISGRWKMVAKSSTF